MARRSRVSNQLKDGVESLITIVSMGSEGSLWRGVNMCGLASSPTATRKACTGGPGTVKWLLVLARAAVGLCMEFSSPGCAGPCSPQRSL